MDSILFGKNAESRVIAVYQAGESTVKLVKRVNGVNVRETRKLYPFFFLSDPALLKGFEKKFWNVELDGNNYYKHLCVFRRWGDLRSAMATVTNNLGKRQETHEKEELFFKPDPVYQFLMQTGITLFKEMDFSELRRMQLDIETFSKFGFSNPSRPEDRIILISLSDNSGWEYMIDGRNKSESEMLTELVEIVKQKDPDVIEGHNVYNFDFPYLMRRAELNKVKLQLGREMLEPKISTGKGGDREIEYLGFEIPGRHIVDTYLLVQNYDATRRELESYGLKNVAKSFGFASPDRVYIEGSKISETWLRDPDLLVKYAFDDVRETKLLAEHLSQTNFYLTQMLPYNYGQLPRGSATKIESLFVREYLRKKHSIPRPQSGRQTSGGYTDIFLRGVAGPIIHADVESLYPSIMLTYGISPPTDELGVFQKTLKHLTKLRLSTKKDMREESDPVRRSRLDAMQSSLKILINSFYGYLGYSRGIFNDYASADKVTETGQKILRQMIAEIIQRGGKLIEVDTDGLYFVPPPNTDNEEAEKQFVSRLARTLPPGINLSLDGRYVKMLSYKKKNYALLGYDGKMKIRGSALISRSMEQFAREFIQESIALMLREDLDGLHKLYADYARKILDRAMPLKKMIRIEAVRESIEDYLAAVKMNRRNRTATFEAAIGANIDLRPGERVSYYIVGNDPNPRTFMNAVLYDERDESSPDYNAQYYARKLGEYAERFSEFFEPEDFLKKFSTDEGSLFTTSLDGVRMKITEVERDEGKIEEEDEE
jgi:DNA polymerase elongation subunit (family B)